MVLLHSDPVRLGTPAPTFENLPATDSKTYSLDSFNPSGALVVAFICNHCPYVLAVIERLVALQDQFKDRGVQLVGINVNDTQRYPADSFEKMGDFVEEYNLNFPYLFDESQQTALDYGALCTPDIFVFDANKTLRYRGRIDDNWRTPSQVTQHDLANALEAIIQGNPAPAEQHPSMGCSIKWKPSVTPNHA